MFVANHYTRIGNRSYIPGEVIDQEIPSEKRAWMLSKGAIYEIPSAENPNSTEGDPTAPALEPPAAPEEHNPVLPPDEPEKAAGGDDTAADPADDGAEEIDMETEPPEIDAMAGIVTTDGPSPEKPQREEPKTAGKASASKKGRKGKAK